MKHKLFLQVTVAHHRNKKKESGKILKNILGKMKVELSSFLNEIRTQGSSIAVALGRMGTANIHEQGRKLLQVSEL